MIDNKYIVGITGIVASGKSLFSKAIKNNGGYLLDADIIAREITNQPTTIIEIKNIFGDIVIDNGKINRAVLRDLIFSDDESRLALNKIMHPKIIKNINDAIKQAETNIIFIDAPLLIETGMHMFTDTVVLVKTTHMDILEQRLMQRDKITLYKARQIIKAQLDDTQKAKYSTVIIQNDGTIEDLINKANEFYKECQSKVS